MDLSEIGNFVNLRHPWELSRSDIFVNIIKKQKGVESVLDIGCGDGFFTEKINEIADIKHVVGIDTALQGDKESKNVIYYKNIEKIKGQKFDLIVLLDVLEHIEYDIDFLNSLKNYLNENGKIIISVPAYQKLFSVHDRNLKHFRRYNRNTLLALINQTGFKADECCEFYASLLFARFFTLKKNIGISDWKYTEKHWITKFARFILNMDYFLCFYASKVGLNLKGLSIYALISNR